MLRHQFASAVPSRKNPAASERLAWAVAAALGLVSTSAWTAGAFPYGPFSDGGGFFSFPYEDGSYSRPRPQSLPASRPARKRSSEARHVEATKVPEQKPAGPLIIAVSIGSQRVTVYDNGEPVANAPISTGMKGHPTPTGVFSIIQKEKWHESNLYSNAPMPFMERITWSGVALHAGVLPGYPASHGCIRLPHEFAVRLYGMTRIGARVIVTRNDIAPFEIDHPRLAELLKKPAAPAAPDSEPKEDHEKASDAAGVPGEGAPNPAASANAAAATDHAAPTMTTARPAAAGGAAGALAADAKAATRLDYVGEAGRPELRPAFNVLAPTTPPGSKATESRTQPVAYAQLIDTPAPAAAPALRPGPVSLFVSRKEGKLFVRKGFEPVFDMPVTIEHPEAVIGTHVFTAGKSADGGMRWLGVSVPNERATELEPVRTKGRGNREERPIVAAGGASRTNASEALDRITLPPEALERIAPLMTAGASLVIADQGLGPETGKETDFIVLTR